MIALGTGSPSASAIAAYLAASIPPQEWPTAATFVRSTATCSPGRQLGQAVADRGQRVRQGRAIVFAGEASARAAGKSG